MFYGHLAQLLILNILLAFKKKQLLYLWANLSQVSRLILVPEPAACLTVSNNSRMSCIWIRPTTQKPKRHDVAITCTASALFFSFLGACALSIIFSEDHRSQLHLYNNHCTQFISRTKRFMKTLKCQLCRELSCFPFFCHQGLEFKHETLQSSVKSIPYDQIPSQLMDVLLSLIDEYKMLKALQALGYCTSRYSPLPLEMQWTDAVVTVETKCSWL